MFVHPNFDPIALQLGPLKVHWYGLMYLLSFGLCFLVANHRAKQRDLPWNRATIEDLVFYIACGIILGGRFGFILFYTKGAFLTDPLMLFRVWEGGMSFHGGVLGVAAATLLFCRKHKKHYLAVGDFVAQFVPIGLACGRIGNFINGELWGRVTDLPWGTVFALAGPQPRHPSQLYEAFLEGLVLFIILTIYSRKPRHRGQVAALFLICYALMRSLVELVRQPDQQFGYLAFDWLTMGQLLSLPMLVLGLWLLFRPTRINSCTNI